ncbi:alpha/beta hydrolase [Streptomyces sp. NPDC002138]|uniref:alpha/beta hydrolase n=1 Tax=Streptomyces sp. NPDC002138 TaxID=3154410 RepID=UPI00332C52E4
MEMLKSLETQKGESATAAHERLRRLDRNFDYIHTECGLVRTTLGALAQELSTQQTRLKAALDDATNHGFTLHADGSVEYPPAGESLLTKQPVPGSSVRGVDRRLFLRELPMHPQAQPPMGASANPNHAVAQEIASRIHTALLAAQEVDSRFTQALNRLVAADGLEVTDATWADATADADLVRKEAGHYLHDTIPLDRSPADRHSWWQGLTDDQRAEYLAVYPDVIGNLDGIPAETRDRANRDNLEMLIGKLSEQGDEKSRNQLEGLRSINDQLWNQRPMDPPMYLLGISDQNNGRAIVSFGNPDTSKNVSAYVPGLGTALDGSFARNDIERARSTGILASRFDPSTASMVWLGYDAPQAPADKFVENFEVMGDGKARTGATSYNQFMAGISATNHNSDPHVTAIGHSYGSLMVGQAAQAPGGIPGADDIVLIGSPGTGAHTADQLGVGREHVWVGAADNDPVTQLPNKAEANGMLRGVINGISGGPTGPLLGGATGFLAGTIATGTSEGYFGTDPADRSFGARRFEVAAGPPAFHSLEDPAPAHSNYFDPQVDPVSAENIARIVAGDTSGLTTQDPR